jgi:hypothetical protein
MAPEERRLIVSEIVADLHCCRCSRACCLALVSVRTRNFRACSACCRCGGCGGFLSAPRRDVFYVRATLRCPDLDGNLSLEHDQLAVKVELARLWLLFLPRSLAVAFLVVTAANGTIWKFNLLARMFAGEPSYVLLIILSLALPLGLATLWAWISERWVLRDTEPCNADSVTIGNGWVSFAFADRRAREKGPPPSQRPARRSWKIFALNLPKFQGSGRASQSARR